MTPTASQPNVLSDADFELEASTLGSAWASQRSAVVGRPDAAQLHLPGAANSRRPLWCARAHVFMCVCVCVQRITMAARACCLVVGLAVFSAQTFNSHGGRTVSARNAMRLFSRQPRCTLMKQRIAKHRRVQVVHHKWQVFVQTLWGSRAHIESAFSPMREQKQTPVSEGQAKVAKERPAWG